MKHLRTCKKDHGGPNNSATVYGHPGSIRVCIKVKETGRWVYSPGWEKRESEPEPEGPTPDDPTPQWQHDNEEAAR